LPPILLRAETVEWLQQLPGEAANDDLERCYGFAHALNADRQLTRETIDDEGFRWRLEILDPTGTRVLETALSRQVVRAEHLRSDRRKLGPVAYNHLFEVKTAYRRNKLATRVYEAEGELYRRWGLREIHMTAMHDGLWVWTRREFGFRPANAGALAAEYPGWARARGQPLQPPQDIVDYPEEFLRSRNQLDLYKVLA
jgi:hypothetical protein